MRSHPVYSTQEHLQDTPFTEMIKNSLVMAIRTLLKSLEMAILFRVKLTVNDDVIEPGFLISSEDNGLVELQISGDTQISKENCT